MAIELTDTTLPQVLLQHEVVVVDFWAEWCGPCKIMSKIIDAVAAQNIGKALVGKLDVDKYKTSAQEYLVRNIPTILFFKKGVLVDKLIGSVAQLTIDEKIADLLK